MLSISTRQNRNGNWWCSTTYNCYDISVEGKSINEAQTLIQKELASQNYNGKIQWESNKVYTHMPKNNIKPPQIGYASYRIDRGLV